MQNLVDAINALQVALEVELSLRQATNVEWANGNQNGPMKQAHDVAMKQVVEAAKYVVSIASTE